MNRQAALLAGAAEWELAALRSALAAVQPVAGVTEHDAREALADFLLTARTATQRNPQ